MAPITIISSPPRSVTAAEHRQLIASTPASFSDIPPVLRHKEESVAVSLDPPLEGFSPEDSAKGTLYVTERYCVQLLSLWYFISFFFSVLAFLSETGKGFQIEYPTITLHAIARGEVEPTIYCQLDEALQGQGDGVETEEVQDMRELKLTPTNAASCMLPHPFFYHSDVLLLATPVQILLI